MNDAQIISWIFLAIAVSAVNNPVDFREISEVADGINHAVPNQKEMRLAISWLLKNKLLYKIGKKYALTDDGKDLISDAEEKAKTLLDIWKILENKIDTKLNG